MAKINGIVYMIIGLIIILVSWKVDRKELFVFIYAGYIMIVVGVVKLIFVRKVNTREKAGSTVHPARRHPQRQHTSTHHQSPQASQPHKSAPTGNMPMSSRETKRCLRCSNALSPYDKFCNKCGARIIT